MKSFCLVVLSVGLLNSFCTAQKRNVNSVGIGFYLPAHIPAYDKNSRGYGFTFAREHFFSKKFSGSLSLGYTYFHGQYEDWDGNTKNRFALVPLLIGARYYLHRFYGSFETGAAIKASSNTTTHIVFIPAVGFATSRIDFGFKLFGVPEISYGIPERSYLQKGGYSYFAISAAYRFNY